MAAAGGFEQVHSPERVAVVPGPRGEAPKPGQPSSGRLPTTTVACNSAERAHLRDEPGAGDRVHGVRGLPLAGLHQQVAPSPWPVLWGGLWASTAPGDSTVLVRELLARAPPSGSSSRH